MTGQSLIELPVPDVVPRLVATDLDGTLLRPDGTVSADTATAVAALTALGIVVVVVTGRSPRRMPPVAAALDNTGIGICANGAATQDLGTGRMIDVQPIPPEPLDRIVALLRKRMPGIAFAVDTGTELYHESHYPRRRPKPGVFAVPGSQICRQPAIKLLAHHPEIDAAQVAARVRQLLPTACEATYSSGKGVVEISAFGVHKGSALAALCAEHGIAAAEVAAIGDMPNDIPMLRWAGTAYAVANAHRQVLDVADHRIPGNADDGVAQLCTAIAVAARERTSPV